MCVGDKRPVTNSLREYVCIWAPIVKQTDIQIRMINWADLNLSILTLAAYFRRAATLSLHWFNPVSVARRLCPCQRTKREERGSPLHWERSCFLSTDLCIYGKEGENSCEWEKDRHRERETDAERKTAWAWRIKALFRGVAGNQQELDMQSLLAGLEIWGPYYHCLPYWRVLHRGKECPLAPYTPIHSPHTSSHTFLTYPHYWPVHLPLTLPPFQLISHFTSQTKSLYAPSVCCRTPSAGEKCW